MKVTDEFDIDNGGKIQFGLTRDGGTSSYGKKVGKPSDAVRVARWKDDRSFDPISTAELSFPRLKQVLIASAERDVFSKADLAEMIGALTGSIYRQT